MALNVAVDLQNGRKRFIQTVAVTSTAALTTITTVTVDGVPVGPGCMLCLQGSAAFSYMLRPSTASGTIPITATNSVAVPSGGQEYVKCSQSVVVGSDTKIEMLTATTASVQIFLVDPS